jgi:hypothetical protein
MAAATSSKARMRLPLAVCVIAMSIAPSAGCIDYYFPFDIPATVAGVEFQPNEIAHGVNNSYSVQQTLAPQVQVGAIHLLPDGSWLFAPAYPVTLQNQEFLPADIVSFDGSNYALILHGADYGIPPGARIDALMINNNSRLLISLDIPLDSSSGTLYPSDLESIEGGLYWSGKTAGVPDHANLVGAALDGDQLVVSFDTPLALDGAEYAPGELVQWNGGTSFSLYAQDPGWPAEARPADFAFNAAAGSIPNVLKVTKDANGSVILNWTTSCLATDSDYEIYAGTIGSYYNHSSQLCSTGGATTQQLQPPPGSVYFLVVPRNATAEGSYGKSSNGLERPSAEIACKPRVIACSP